MYPEHLATSGYINIALSTLHIYSTSLHPRPYNTPSTPHTTHPTLLHYIHHPHLTPHPLTSLCRFTIFIHIHALCNVTEYGLHLEITLCTVLHTTTVLHNRALLSTSHPHLQKRPPTLSHPLTSPHYMPSHTPSPNTHT